MSFLKTPTKERTTYKYYDANKRLICELKPGEKGITEVDIQLLHRMDDRIVDNNIKNCRPKINAAQRKKIEDWKKSYIQKFKEENHRSPTKKELEIEQDKAFPKNWSLSLSQLTDPDSGGFGDKSHFLVDFASNPFVSESEPIERLHEVIKKMPENWQEIYKAKYIEGYKNVEIAEMRGVTEGAVRKTLKKIKKRISDDPQLKKYFSRGTKFD